jgi:uncharacterized protein involved in high-affinity Fe2+ transport
MGYMAVTNLIGAAVYATRVTMLSARKDRQLLIIPDPRQIFPFQIRHIWLQSPDLPCSGHVLVIIAAWLHLNGLLHASRVTNNTAYAC